jgi:uroporphyrinogen-III decarboxylase
MDRAKKTVGQVACIAGNVPVSLLCTATPDDVQAYCKNLMDVAGRDGGFIFSTGAGMQGAKPENVKTMIDLGAALLRRPLLTVSGSLYCFILDNLSYLITFR